MHQEESLAKTLSYAAVDFPNPLLGAVDKSNNHPGWEHDQMAAALSTMTHSPSPLSSLALPSAVPLALAGVPATATAGEGLKDSAGGGTGGRTSSRLDTGVLLAEIFDEEGDGGEEDSASDGEDNGSQGVLPRLLPGGASDAARAAASAGSGGLGGPSLGSRPSAASSTAAASGTSRQVAE